MVYDFGISGKDLLSGAYYQQGAANTLVPQQTNVARSELQNQQGFYDAQQQVAQSQKNPFLQMLAYQMSPKMSPSDASLRGLAYGSGNAELAQQFAPASGGLTPTNMRDSLYQQNIMNGMNPQSAMVDAAQRVTAMTGSAQWNPQQLQFQQPYPQFYGQPQPQYQPQPQVQTQPQQIIRPQPQVQPQPQMVTDDTIDMQTQPLTEQPIAPQSQYTNDPQLISSLTGYTPAQVLKMQEYRPDKLNEEIQKLSDETDLLNSNIPQIAEVTRGLMDESIDTGVFEPSKVWVKSLTEDIFGSGALTDAAGKMLQGQGLVNYLGTKLSVQNMQQYYSGKGSFSNAEGARVDTLGVNLKDNEFKNIYVGAASQVAAEARQEKLQAKAEYIKLAGSPTAPLALSDGSKKYSNWQEFYKDNYQTTRLPYTAAIAQKFGQALGIDKDETGGVSAKPLTDKQRLTIKAGAYNLDIKPTGTQKQKDLAQQEIDKVLNTDDIILQKNNKYYITKGGQFYPLQLGGE